MGILSRMSRAAAGLTKYYYPYTWKNKPSIESPINATNLNHIEAGVNELDNRILILAQDKADKTDMENVLIDFEMDDATGVMTFTRLDGSTVKHDTAMEKIALNCYLEDDNFVLELADGTKQKVSLAKFVDTYTFASTDTIKITVNGKDISADIPDGKITLAKLEPTIMSTIRQYSLDAQTAKGVAEQAASTAQGWAIGGTGFEETSAKYYAEQSKRYAVGGVEEGDTEDCGKYYYTEAKRYAGIAEQVSAVEIATAERAGIVKPDGSTITVDIDGTLHGAPTVSTAADVTATDVQGLVGTAGAESNMQALIDAVAAKVVRELVSNTALAEQLAGYIATSRIANDGLTTEAGYVADARQLNPSITGTLAQQLSVLNSNLDTEIIYIHANYGCYVIKSKKFLRISFLKCPITIPAGQSVEIFSINPPLNIKYSISKQVVAALGQVDLRISTTGVITLSSTAEYLVGTWMRLDETFLL